MFIAASTFVMVRVMGLPEVTYIDAAASRRAHRWLAAAVVVTALPSVFLAQRLVAKEVFNARAARFIAVAFPADAPTFIVDRDVDADRRQVRVTVLGTPITDAQRQTLQTMLPSHGLEGATLRIDQAEQQTLDVAALRSDLAGELYQRTLAELRTRDATIARLEAELLSARSAPVDLEGLEAEIVAQYPEVGGVVVAAATAGGVTRLVVGLGDRKPLDPGARERLRTWLGLRAGAREVWVFEDPTIADAKAAPDPQGAGTTAAEAPPSP